MDDGAQFSYVSIRIYPEPGELAFAQLKRLRGAGIERIHFAWAGGFEPGEAHYYRLHGPTLLIEYDTPRTTPITSTQCGFDPTNDFGVDLPTRAL